MDLWGGGAPVLEPIEHSVLEKPLDDGPVEGAPVLEPIDHSVLEKPLDGGPLLEMSVLESLEHSVPDVAPAVRNDCVGPDGAFGLGCDCSCGRGWRHGTPAGHSAVAIDMEWLSGELCRVQFS